jgi:hypothetical protein
LSKGTAGSIIGGAIGFVITAGNPLGAQIGAFIPGVICCVEDDEKQAEKSEPA